MSARIPDDPSMKAVFLPTRTPLMRTLLRFLLPCLAALGPLALTQCAPTQTYRPPPPPGVVRAPDGTYYYDPNGEATAAANPEAPRATAPPDLISYWSGEPGNGPARIVIRLDEQTAYFYKGTELVGKSWLSTGDVNHPTPRGKFKILQKSKWHKSSRYGAAVDAAGNVVIPEVDLKKDKIPPGLRYEGAKMTNFMRLTWDGVGMHAGFLPGYPASHGCIRMPEHMSELFFNNVQLGTPVTIE